MVQVYVSSVIDAPADTVWSRIRDFNALPAVASGHRGQPHRERRGADKVGCVRNFHTRDGG
jgi:hypothetical protein